MCNVKRWVFISKLIIMIMAKKSERKEALMRIIVAVISSIVLGLWGYVIGFASVINWLIAAFSGKRSRRLAEFCEPWNTEQYKLMRYMTFVSNKRPFPFSKIERISKYS